MDRPLTDKQRSVLEFLRGFAPSRSFAPTAREGADRFGIAEKNAFYSLELLERKGYIRRHRKSPRRIEFLGEAALPSPLRVPVLGRVPAGSPREAIELAGEGEAVGPVVAGEAPAKGTPRRSGEIRLEPANPAYAPVDVPNGSPSFRI